MEVKIFDVSHGFCALLTADNGNRILFDCGHNEKTNFRPSQYLDRYGINRLEYFVIQNFDQDHLSDLPELRKKVYISTLFRNKTIPPEILKSWKLESGFITPAMQEALDLHSTYIYDNQSPVGLAGAELRCFYNNYPSFDDTNNLSVVSFILFDGMGIAFTGDVERPGWQELLKNYGVREYLKSTNIFIASHHGRESGYCEEVFKYCSPDIVIISDKEIIYDTQKQNYAQHAKGLPWNNGIETRYVLTTRSDGMISISKRLNEAYFIRSGLIHTL